ncbi:class I SAM-dependent methyltransferase [Dyella sp. C11]|uniref:class I SAM-dependent methyltransferase n=1 Tax=Dyella sp. C11 TaxID=2126991 RepID=UPI000D6413B4|nr:class I SAM-dependent methyltransferase [Dyella sp. C11]
MTQESFKPISVKAPSDSRWMFAIRCLVDLQMKTIAEYLRPAMATLRGRVLDVGAGESPWREWLPANATYHGIDVGNADDFGMQAQRPDITYYDGRTIPFGDGEFDGVICIEVLEHVEQPDALITEIARCMKPGATLLLTVPWSARRHHIPHDYHRFTRERLLDLFRAGGFSQVDVRERGTDILVIANKLIVLNARLMPSRNLLRSLWTLPLFIGLVPVTLSFLCVAHIADAVGAGAKEDPLGYFVRATKG